MSVSLYAPPSSPIPDGAPVAPVLRWHAAVIFAALPLIALVVLQLNHMLEHSFALNVNTLEPALVMLPLALVMAASGFAAAPACVRHSFWRTVLVAVVVCLAWAALILVAGNVYQYIRSATLLSPGRQLTVYLQILPWVAPVALFLCAALRWHGRREGFGAPE